MKTTQHLRIRGRVQGVGFRQAMRAAAGRLGCTGWVRNRTDGSVEAVLQGPVESVDALIAWARRGPPAGWVDGIDVGPGEGNFDRFEVVRTA